MILLDLIGTRQTRFGNWFPQTAHLYSRLSAIGKPFLSRLLGRHHHHHRRRLVEMTVRNDRLEMTVPLPFPFLASPPSHCPPCFSLSLPSCSIPVPPLLPLSISLSCPLSRLFFSLFLPLSLPLPFKSSQGVWGAL